MKRAVMVRMWKTRIGGRRGIVRVWRVVLDGAFTWGVPWGEYERPVFVRLHHMAFGWRFAFRLGKPYFKCDVSLLPARLFLNGNGPVG